MSSRIMHTHHTFGARRPGSGGATVNFFDALMSWHDRSRQRQDLKQLDDRLLRDIGVSRAEAEAEARKPFWRR